ncbi:MAG: HAD family phosphatase [Clostridia bacterium]|nr:HAD family phosphatase [Clostridia bacterium]
MEKDIIMFDFDNTLVDSLPLWYKVLDEEMFTLYGKKVDKNMPQLRVGKSNQEMAETFIKITGINADYKQIFNDWHSKMAVYYTTKIKMIKGAKEFLYILKKQGKTLVLASATQENLLKIALKHFKIDIFDYIFTEESLNHPKYEPDFFEIILDKLNTQASDITFFEDSFSSIKSATSKGIECYALLHKYNKKHKKELTKLCSKVIKDYKGM